VELNQKVVQTPEEFGAVLRAQRKARHLTQAGAAELAGVGARLWNEAELGKRTQLGMDTALRMLQTLGLDLAIVPRHGHARRGG
jgi:HTH-type transcriptional regulator / antitoxin HipB